MKPISDVKILHRPYLEEFAWAESNDPKHRDDDTTKGFCEDFRDCTNVTYQTSSGLGGSDYTFTSNGCIGRIAINCDDTGDEYVRYQIDITDLGTTDFEMFEARVKVTSSDATIKLYGVFTTAGATQLYSSSSLSWDMVHVNLYDLVGNDTLESIRIELNDTDVFDGGWLYGFIDWIRVYKLRDWQCGTVNKDGAYWNNDGVLRMEGNTTGSNWLELVKGVSFNRWEYPYVAFRARAVNGGKYRIAFSTSNYSEHTNTDWEVFVKHWDDFTGTVANNPTNFYVSASDNGQTDGGAEIDWIVICRDPIEVSKAGHFLRGNVRRGRNSLGSFNFSIANPQVTKDSLFYNNVENTQTETETYNDETYESGWQCACRDATHWDSVLGSGNSDTSDGNFMIFTVGTGPSEWEHSPYPTLPTTFYRKLKVRMRVESGAASLAIKFGTVEGNWYTTTTWSNNAQYLTRVVDIYTLCQGETIDNIRVRMTGNGNWGRVDFIKIYADVEEGLYNQRIVGNDLVIMRFSIDGTTYDEALAGHVGFVDVTEKQRSLTVSGKSRAGKYKRILENEVHFETTVDAVYKDLIDELGGYLRTDYTSDTPLYLWFHEIKATNYWDAIQKLSKKVSFNAEINDSNGLTFDFIRPKLVEDFFENDDPPRPVMWREWSEVGVNGGAARTDWSIASGNAESTADSYLFYDKWITDDFEMNVTWERDTSDAGDDHIYFYYLDHQNHYYAEIDYVNDLVELRKVVNGSDTQLSSGSVTLSANIEYKITIKANSGNLTILVDDNHIDTVSDSTFDEGRIGFYTNQAIEMNSFRMRVIGYNHRFIDRKDVATSSHRTGYDEIVNYLWVWGKPTAESRAIFAEYWDQESINEYGVSEGILMDTDTTSTGMLKQQAILNLEESKTPASSVGVSIFGDATVSPGDVVFLDSRYHSTRRKYAVDAIRHKFDQKGYFTELQLVKV